MAYIPTTDAERRKMLADIGVTATEELFADVPPKVRFPGMLKLPQAMREAEILAHLQTLSKQNVNLDNYACFMGGGAYEHLIPVALPDILSRNEFVTAYTPYQAEISQGVLQCIYEFQSLMCLLTGMDVANASVYDGGSACAEGAIMACGHTNRNTVLLAEGLHPEYREVVQTYLSQQGLSAQVVPINNGTMDMDALRDMLTSEVAGVIVQHPNFFGCLEPMQAIGEAVHEADAVFVTCVDPVSLGVLAPPAAYNADIAVGNGQPLGNDVSFGGPYFGFMAAKQELLRRLPGRIVGATVDHAGRRGFVLTLQTREQHIRREKATSNICTNQALNALAATVYLALLGKRGLSTVANQCLQKAHYAYSQMENLPGWRPTFPGAAFYQEFTMDTDYEMAEVNERLLDYQIIGALPLVRFGESYKDKALFCVTEARTRNEIDRLVQALHSL